MVNQMCVLCDREADPSKDKLKQFGLKVVHNDCLQELLKNWDTEGGV